MIFSRISFNPARWKIHLHIALSCAFRSRIKTCVPSGIFCVYAAANSPSIIIPMSYGLICVFTFLKDAKEVDARRKKKSAAGTADAWISFLKFLWNFLLFKCALYHARCFLLLFFFQTGLTDARPPQNNCPSIKLGHGDMCVRTVHAARD